VFGQFCVSTPILVTKVEEGRKSISFSEKWAVWNFQGEQQKAG